MDFKFSIWFVEEFKEKCCPTTRDRNIDVLWNLYRKESSNCTIHFLIDYRKNNLLQTRQFYTKNKSYWARSQWKRKTGKPVICLTQDTYLFLKVTKWYELKQWFWNSTNYEPSNNYEKPHWWMNDGEHFCWEFRFRYVISFSNAIHFTFNSQVLFTSYFLTKWKLVNFCVN